MITKSTFSTSGSFSHEEPCRPDRGKLQHLFLKAGDSHLRPYISPVSSPRRRRRHRWRLTQRLSSGDGRTDGHFIAVPIEFDLADCPSVRPSDRGKHESFLHTHADTVAAAVTPVTEETAAGRGGPVAPRRNRLVLGIGGIHCTDS